MPRIQVMHLPAPADEYPFILVIDEVENIEGYQFTDKIREQTGASAVLVFEDRVEVA